ncbi:MAG: VWA domain-containing protein [Vicinamibacterales bacterium]
MAVNGHGQMAGARFVDPKILARVGNLELLARNVVDGFINGLHRAPFFGASIDFAEHRGYVPGDDIRRVDWRLYARTDRYYIKQYEADTNTNFTVLFDISKSMSFASEGVSKLEYASFLAACLSYLAHRQRDRVGIITFDESIVTHVPPSAKHFDQVLHTLDQARAVKPGRLSAPLNAMAEHFKRRGVLLLISDFYDDPDAILDAIKPLRFLGNDLIVFHVLDPQEIDFDFDDASTFQDLESGEQVPVVPQSFRAEYRRLIQEHITKLSTKFSEQRIDYALCNTREPLESRPLLVSVESREALAREIGRHADVVPLSAPARRPRRDCRAGARASHSARAQARRRIPVADVRAEIPYQSVRRRRIRHWALLLLRAAAMALIVAAFARPFLPSGAAAVLGATGGSREVVILLDQSASMGYGDRWQRAKDEAARVIGSIGAIDKATLVLFSRNAEENMRATSDRGRLDAALRAAQLTSSGTRFGPALKLAESILARSTLQRKEAVLISDFQKTGWTGSEDVRFPEGMTLTPVSVATETVANLAVPSVTFTRSSFSNQERITVTAGVANKSATAVTAVPVSLEIDGRVIETLPVNVAANASASVSFSPFTLSEPSVHGVVKAGTNPMPADNTFDFVVTPSQSVSILLVDNGDNSSFFVRKALGIGNTPTFNVEVVPASRVTPQMLEKRSAVILNDTGLPSGFAGGALKKYVDGGGGLLIAVGDRTNWPQNDVDLLPGQFGQIVDRLDGRGATIGFRDYSHPVFEVFKAPRSGDFSAARVLRYRTLQPTADARILARYDDGGIAMAERRVGSGRTIVMTTTLDESWNDLELKPVYLPLVHQLMRYLAQYEQSSSWATVGQVVDLATLLKGKADRVIVTPSGERRTIGANDPSILELTEHGAYEVRNAATPSGRADQIAVNIDTAESDLTSNRHR